MFTVNDDTYNSLLTKVPFNIIEWESLHFSHDQLLEYYLTLEKDYQHLKFTRDMLQVTTDQNRDFEFKYRGFKDWFTYAIQSRVNDFTKPQVGYKFGYPEPDATEGDLFNTPSLLAFGFGKQMLDKIPGISRLIITAHPPNSYTYLHRDLDYTVPVHIPIQTNDTNIFEVNKIDYNLKIGKAYIINALLPHRVKSFGDSHRIHMFFHIPIDNVQKLLQTDIYL